MLNMVKLFVKSGEYREALDLYEEPRRLLLAVLCSPSSASTGSHRRTICAGRGPRLKRKSRGRVA